jgi:Holliday junction resolvase RusA-like endonuclease
MPLEQALHVELEFAFVRPARPSRNYPCTSGGLDVDKMARACLDAMKGIVWVDDSQVVKLVASKAFGQPGVLVVVRAL